jgi:subfamily B ATP-binding cassette protein MsbA
MKRPSNRLIPRVVAGALALATLALGIAHLVQRHDLEREVQTDLSARRDALADRLDLMVRAQARHLMSLSTNRVLQEKGEDRLEVGETPFFVRRVGEENLYTGVTDTGEIAIPVAVEQEAGSRVYFYRLLPLDPIRDAMAEIWPGKGGQVYLTDRTGRPVLSWPERNERGSSTEHQKFRLSSDAMEGVARQTSAVGLYKNLDDRDAVGAFRPLEILHGGVIVEREQRRAFVALRGVQPWHVSGGLLSISLVVLLLSMVAPRIRFAQDLFRLYAYAKRYWWLILLTFLVMGVYAGGNMVRLTLMKTVFDDVLLGKGSGAMEALWWVMRWFALVVVVMAAASWFRAYSTKYTTEAVTNDIRCAVAAHLLTLDMKYFDRQRAGEVMSRLSNDVGQTRRSLGLLFGEFFEAPLMLLGALGAAFIVNWRLSLLIFAGVPLIIFPISKLGRMVKKYAKRRQVQAGVVTEVMLQTISGVRIVKSFQMEERENERLYDASRGLLKQTVRVAKTTALSRTVIDLMNSLGAMIILTIGGYMVIHGTAGATAADLMTLSVIMAQMYKPVKDLTKTYNNIQESLAGAERIFEIMDQLPDIVDRPDAVPLVRPEREIAFENVTFAYEEQPVLKNISFRAEVGEVVALVGETGAGKSTVTDLVARFYDPDQGRVSIDGRDLRDYQIMSLRHAIAMVTQESFLFNTSVRENIAIGRPGASLEEIREAAKSAGIHDEILEMSKGYETEVGERGGRLSGGQRQRVTIARAILKDAPILILDEATSALDSQTEALVQEAIGRLMSGRTTFVVAHRLSTIAHADKILVLRDGEIVEEGTHESLMDTQDGIYQAIAQMQFAGTNGNS